MKLISMVLGMLGLTTFLVGCGPGGEARPLEAASTPDITTAESGRYTTEFENDVLRVLRIRYGPGERSVPHSHPAGCGVVLAGETFSFQLPSGDVVTGETVPQSVGCTDREVHDLVNVGMDDAEFIFFDLKDRMTFDNVRDPRRRGGVTSAEGIPDALAADPHHYAVEFENDKVRVLRAHYPVGDSSRMHSHPASCAVYLTGGRFRFTSPGGESLVEEREQGQVNCRPAGVHRPENIGPVGEDIIILEMKGRRSLGG
jgi:quercetin dioxygenase-like cupin family protein